MWKERLVVAAVVGSLVLSLLVLVWRENERRYAAFAPPLIDWRRFCN